MVGILLAAKCKVPLTTNCCQWPRLSVWSKFDLKSTCVSVCLCVWGTDDVQGALITFSHYLLEQFLSCFGIRFVSQSSWNYLQASCSAASSPAKHHIDKMLIFLKMESSTSPLDTRWQQPPSALPAVQPMTAASGKWIWSQTEKNPLIFITTCNTTTKNLHKLIKVPSISAFIIQQNYHIKGAWVPPAAVLAAIEDFRLIVH